MLVFVLCIQAGAGVVYAGEGALPAEEDMETVSEGESVSEEPEAFFTEPEVYAGEAATDVTAQADTEDAEVYFSSGTDSAEPLPDMVDPEEYTAVGAASAAAADPDSYYAEEDTRPALHISAINDILAEKNVLAVLYLDETYPLRSEPNLEAPQIAHPGCGTTLHLHYAVINGAGYWFCVTAYMPEGDIHGFLPMDSFICVDEDFLTWRVSLGDYYISDGDITPLGAGSGDTVSTAQTRSVLVTQAAASVNSFPEVYRSRLLGLLDAHPNWVFVPKKTGMTLEEAVSDQMSDVNRNWVYYTVDDRFKGEKVNNSWYYASREGLLYYMNPVNFIGSEQNVFMFEQQTYNSSYHTEEGVASVLGGTFMSGEIPGEGITYARAFYEIGSSLKVSPYHLASRVYQEQGSGTSPLISGGYPGYEGYYNYFNVGATGRSNEAVYKSGLSYAKKAGWNTRYKSLAGGAEFDSNNYVLAGQDTLYLEKYNVIKKNYNHQYMQNASAPLTESASVYKMYAGSGALNCAFVFTIPVYEGDYGETGGESGEEGYIQETVTAPRPSVTFAEVVKPNLFFTRNDSRSSAQFAFRCAGTITDIRVNDGYEADLAASGKPYYTIENGGFDIDSGLLTLTPVNLNASNYGKLKKKVKVDVTIDGYDPVTYTLNVKTVNAKPSVKAEEAYLYGTANTAFIRLSGAALPDDVTVRTTYSHMSVELNETRDGVLITTDGSFKAGKKKLIFESASWRSAIMVTAQVRVVKNPRIRLQTSKLRLNTALNSTENGMQTVKAYVAGSGLDFGITRIEGANDASSQLLDRGYLDYEINGAEIGLGLVPANRGDVKAGTYKFVLSGIITDAEEDFGEKNVSLSVVISDKAPTSLYKLSAKGSVNLTDRADTRVILTPGIKDLGAKRLAGVSLNNYTDEFEAVFYPQGSYLPDGSVVTANTGVIAVSAREGATLRSDTKYPLELVSTLENGLEITKTVKIKPVNKPARVTGNVSSLTMNRGGKGRIFMISSAGRTAADSIIESVELAGASQYFTYTPADGAGGSRSYSGTLTTIGDTCKAGKYKVKFKICFKGQAENAKPATVTLNVTVK